MYTMFAAVAIFGLCTIDGATDRSAKFVIFAKPVPAHANKQYPTQFQLLPDKSGSVGYIKLYTTREDGFGVSESGKLEVVSYPKLNVREGAYGRTIGSWPCISDGAVKIAISDSWTEIRLGDDGIKRPKAFHVVKIVISSMIAGIHNDVTIFATDYDKPEKLVEMKKLDEPISNQWIIMDARNARKLVAHIDAGDKVIITVETPDSS